MAIDPKFSLSKEFMDKLSELSLCVYKDTVTYKDAISGAFLQKTAVEAYEQMHAMQYAKERAERKAYEECVKAAYISILPPKELLYEGLWDFLHQSYFVSLNMSNTDISTSVLSKVWRRILVDKGYNADTIACIPLPEQLEKLYRETFDKEIIDQAKVLKRRIFDFCGANSTLGNYLMNWFVESMIAPSLQDLRVSKPYTTWGIDDPNGPWGPEEDTYTRSILETETWLMFHKTVLVTFERVWGLTSTDVYERSMQSMLPHAPGFLAQERTLLQPHMARQATNLTSMPDDPGPWLAGLLARRV